MPRLGSVFYQLYFQVFAVIEQVLREWPPGYGGVERVAHELASVLGGVVYSLDVQGHSSALEDPLLVTYPESAFPRRFRFVVWLPLPSRQLLSLLVSRRPLHGHCLPQEC